MNTPVMSAGADQNPGPEDTLSRSRPRRGTDAASQRAGPAPRLRRQDPRPGKVSGFSPGVTASS